MMHSLFIWLVSRINQNQMLLVLISCLRISSLMRSLRKSRLLHTGTAKARNSLRIIKIMGGSRVREVFGLPPPLKNHKNIGLICNTGLDPMKITKPPSEYSTSSHHLPASETPFQWRFAGGRFASGPMMTQLKRYLDPLSPDQQKKKLSNLDPSGSAHENTH